MDLRTYIVRENSSGRLFVVTTNLEVEDAVYRQFAVDWQKNIKALDTDFDTGNVDIDVFTPPTLANVVPLEFEGDSDVQSDRKD